jgi:hypothetical protein
LSIQKVPRFRLSTTPRATFSVTTMLSVPGSWTMITFPQRLAAVFFFS